MKAWIGLGSNIGDGPVQIGRALAALEEQPEVALLRKSSLYRSKPWGVTGQPDFHNAVAELETQLAPLALLQLLQKIESDQGRRRDGERWQPRCIDLDLLLCGDGIYSQPGLEVPHPLMHLRAFVLEPLAELDPELSIPGKGSVRSQLARLGPQGVERVDQAD